MWPRVHGASLGMRSARHPPTRPRPGTTFVLPGPVREGAGAQGWRRRPREGGNGPGIATRFRYPRHLDHLRTQVYSGPRTLWTLSEQMEELFSSGLFVLFYKYGNAFDKNRTFINRILYLCVGREHEPKAHLSRATFSKSFLAGWL